eukprot:1420089-Rhodomonas_salina.1
MSAASTKHKSCVERTPICARKPSASNARHAFICATSSAMSRSSECFVASSPTPFFVPSPATASTLPRRVPLPLPDGDSALDFAFTPSATSASDLKVPSPRLKSQLELEVQELNLSPALSKLTRRPRWLPFSSRSVCKASDDAATVENLRASRGAGGCGRVQVEERDR